MDEKNWSQLFAPISLCDIFFTRKATWVRPMINLSPDVWTEANKKQDKRSEKNLHCQLTQETSIKFSAKNLTKTSKYACDLDFCVLPCPFFSFYTMWKDYFDKSYTNWNYTALKWHERRGKKQKTKFTDQFILLMPLSAHCHLYYKLTILFLTPGKL